MADHGAVSFGSGDAEQAFPLGAAVTLDQLDLDPHPVLAALREREPVSWLPALEGWLVTRYDLAVHVMRDAETFTVEDPRFSTAQVVGPSMLSLDGEAHSRHRAPFAAPFRPRAVRERFATAATDEADRLIDTFADDGAAELRRSFAGPLAASIMARALGLEQGEVGTMLGWYDAIVAAVTDVTAGHDVPISAGDAFDSLSERLEAVIAAGPEASLLGAAASREDLTTDQVVSNAAVLLFGGIETTEGMIANALLAPARAPRCFSRGSTTTGAGWTRHSRSRSGSSRPPQWSIATPPPTSTSVILRYARAISSASRSAPPTATRRCFPTPTASTRRALTDPDAVAISRSPTARTCASAFTWRGSRPGPLWTSSCAACPTWRSIQAGCLGSKGSCSASHRTLYAVWD